MAKVACIICGKGFHPKGIYVHQAHCRKATQQVGENVVAQMKQPEATSPTVDIYRTRQDSYRQGLCDAIDVILREVRQS